MAVVAASPICQFAGPKRALARGRVPRSSAVRHKIGAVLFLCCHPALTPASQVALTLRAAGANIAHPMATLNRAVAVAMVRGPAAGLDLLRPLDADERMAGHHRLEAVRAHLLEMAGDRVAARSSYRTAARRTTSLPEQGYLEARAARLIDA